MSTRAIGYIMSYDHPSAGQVSYYLDIALAGGPRHFSIVAGPYDVDVLAKIGVNTQLIQFVRNYVNSMFDAKLDPVLDAVQLISNVS